MNTYIPEPSLVSASMFFHFEPDTDVATPNGLFRLLKILCLVVAVVVVIVALLM
jgi:hypothetical protein